MAPMTPILALWELDDWAFAGLELGISLLGALEVIGVLYLIYLDTGSALRRDK